jgi:hypothetical protein
MNLIPEPYHILIWIVFVLFSSVLVPCSFSDDQWVVYEGGSGPGSGKHVVLISGDEEYRSEEALPQLAKILATHHGFTCTVLFAVDPDSGIINPVNQNNIPGLELLETADLAIIFTRFRGLPNDQMQQFDDYLKSGRPVLGLRTATHAFMFGEENPWAHYGNGYAGEQKAWQGGFGRLVLGEKWITHHGAHKHESTRGVVAAGAAGHPITRGIRAGDIWGPTDVYGVRLPLPEDSQPIIAGEVMTRKGNFDANDSFYGLRPDDGPPVEGEKNDPLMPIVWTKTYQLPDGQPGRALTSTIGASVDLVAEGTRRVLVNGVYWCLGMEEQIPEQGTEVALVGTYEPTKYGSHPDEYWKQRQMKPAEHQR